MKTKFLLLVLLLFPFVTILKAQVDVGDSLALVDLYNATGGPGWIYKTNWLTKMPVSTWYNVKVKNRNVSELYLGFNHLTGRLPESIGNFDSIRIILFDYDSLTGIIPASIGNLKTLEQIDLLDNQLTGEIPESIGNLTHLTAFTAGYNMLTGSIPESIGNCANLSSLGLTRNKLTGAIPASLSQCTHLNAISLAENRLTGNLPSFKKLNNLSFLVLYKNKLSGTFTDVFAEEAPLDYLAINDNDFTGAFPAFISRFTALTDVYMYNNHFTGTLPASLQNLTNLNYLFLYNNLLTADNNPIFSGKKDRHIDVLLEKNRFTFNGLEYFVKKYQNIGYNPQSNLSIHFYQNKLTVSAGGTLSNNTYKWFKIGQPQSVTILGDSTFQPTRSGSYYARVSNSVVVGLTLKTDTFTYVMPLAKNELNTSVSPNPARGVISIYGLDEKSDAKITIADMSGYVWMTAISRKQSAMKIDVNRLKAGNYLVSVNDGNEVKTVHFVKE